MVMEGLPTAVNCGSKSRTALRRDSFTLTRVKLRRGHFGEIAEAANDAVEIGEFGFESGGAFGKNFLKLLRAQLTGALQVFERDLQGE